MNALCLTTNALYRTAEMGALLRADCLYLAGKRCTSGSISDLRSRRCQSPLLPFHRQGMKMDSNYRLNKRLAVGPPGRK